MGKRLNFSALEELFLSGNSFELTDNEYQAKIGKPMPKGNDYLKYSSPLANAAHEHGYRIDVVEEPIVIRKLRFIKNSETN